ncbi:putative pentatricopeptide repeat-containing protein At5g08490 [Cryptomeria japonica]|uniref:putative pentatricopeptide repeat-containing protein At5g08490 n=1 Tax=Cryptomeria japonica TaxID=3369 RepID=UPI0027DA6524|nr:putative pentatricopeptide repeat-containing protein At5g08490 [Cryptomeria japonica]
MHGCCEEALKLFRKMQLKGVRADNFTFPSVLKACAGMSFLEQGKEIHGLLIKCGFEGDLGVGKAIVNMYGKCGSVEDAHLVFDKMPQRDLVLWNVMIASYSQSGYCYEALEVFLRMQLSGEMPNCVTIATVLQVCACLEITELGKNVHSYSIKCGLQSEVLVGNALLNMYAKCRGIWDASRVFNEVNQKDAVSWNAMIAGYGQVGHADQALEHFYQMLMSGVKPNTVTILCVLSVCGLSQGKEIHAYVIRSRIQLDVSVGNAMLDMYSKCMAIELARRVFEKMVERDIISWNAIIAGYAQNAYFSDAIDLFGQMQLAGVKPDAVTIASVLSACACLENLRKGKGIHAYIIRNRAFAFDIAVSNALITLYASCGNLEVAGHVFVNMSERDLVSWNAMISTHVQKGCCREAINLFHQMEKTYVKPDSVTISSVLSACARLSALKLGLEIHGYIIKSSNLSTDVVVGNALIDMYAKCGRVLTARQEFDKMLYKNIVSNNVMIAGYAKCGDKESAENVFDKMCERNISSWNAMIALNTQHGYGNEALELFRQAQLAGIQPNNITVASILSACSQVAALQRGKEIHDYIIKRDLDSDVFVTSAIIDMYAKCGSLQDACQIFEKTSKLDVVIWTAMISAHAIHGHGEDALSIFHQMQQAGFKPDHVTFTAVLSACSHAGLVDQGWQNFNCMIKDYCITPNMEHYACMVDLLGRAGHLQEAYNFIKNMPLKPHSRIWGTLLAACRIYHNTDLGELVADHIFELEPTDTGNYVLLSNIYAAVGRWDGVQRIRKFMKDKGLKKMPGYSWIEVKNRVYTFLVEDIACP